MEDVSNCSCVLRCAHDAFMGYLRVLESCAAGRVASSGGSVRDDVVATAVEWRSTGTGSGVRIGCSGGCCGRADGGGSFGAVRDIGFLDDCVVANEVGGCTEECAKGDELRNGVLSDGFCEVKDVSVSGRESVGLDGGSGSKGTTVRPKGVGLNWERNVESRKKKKENKKKKKNIGLANSTVGKDIPSTAAGVDDHCEPKLFRPAPEWRRGAGSGEPGSVKKGFSFCNLADSERLELQRSRADMLKAQNELAMMRAQRQVKVLQGNDVDLEVQKYRTKLSSDVEKNMVSIEQTHAYLAKTGNVPGVGSAVPSFVGGTVETVLSGTISPNSSVSEAEVRKMQKDLLDKDAQLEKVSVFLERTMGVNMKYMDLYEKEEWTDTPENMDILAEMFPEGNYVTMPLSYDDKRFAVRRFG